MDRIGPNRPNRNKVNGIGLNKNEWTEQDRSRLNGLNGTKLDELGPQLIDWIEADEVDRIRAMQTEQNRMDKMNRIKPKWTNWTKQD